MRTSTDGKAVKRWTLTHRWIETGRVTFGFSFARYPSKGWGFCLNLFKWYADLNYRKAR